MFPFWVKKQKLDGFNDVSLKLNLIGNAEYAKEALCELAISYFIFFDLAFKAQNIDKVQYLYFIKKNGIPVCCKTTYQQKNSTF